MTKKTGDEFREELVWRASFETVGRWGIPVVRRQPLVDGEIDLISCADARPHNVPANTSRGLHFFVDDPRFEVVYTQPELTFPKYGQYRFMLTPDYSVYADMKPWQQLQSVAKSRWCGAFWQSKGKTVYPTMAWGSPQSFEFCFLGYERGGTVAVSTVGCRLAETGFMLGYREMLRALEPEHVICLGRPFDGMEGEADLIVVDYMGSRRTVR